MNKALLPAGFHDLIFPKAGIQVSIVEKLTKYFAGFGYVRIEPPALEFEESLFAGAGKALENNTFRLMDPASHQMMGVRSDITVQIARIAATRLTNVPTPLRLSYAGDVFRVKGDGLHAERQFTQTGIELIGIDNAEADAEVIITTLNALKSIGVRKLCIDFNIPCLTEIILNDLKIENNNEIIHAIKKKDADAIKKLTGKKADILLKLISCHLDIKAILKLKMPKPAIKLCQRLADVIQIVQNNINDIHISIDPLESANPGYYQGIGFSIFAKGAKVELGRGGRYSIDKGVDGIGATLYVNDLFRLLPRPKEKDKIFTPLGTPQEQIKKLRKDKLIVIQALEKHKNIKKEAIKMGCNFIFDDGKIVKI